MSSARLGAAMLVPLLLLFPACEVERHGDVADGDDAATAPVSSMPADTGAEGAPALHATLARSMALADSIEDLLRPVPLMRPGDEARLRRYLNASHVARARALGVHAADDAAIRRLTESGEFVQLEDSTRYWIVRDGAADDAQVTPDVPRLLTELGQRFQDELAQRGIPPYRLEITSVLRTAAEQAALRRSNPNAAAGTSSHEFGTTLDIAYEAYAPPADTPDGLIPAEAPADMIADLRQVAALALESVSARKSRELKAILGDVLAEMQADGDVLVILENLQPVFHITVGRRFETE